MKKNEFDFLLTPTHYSAHNTFIRECEHFHSQLFDHKDEITASVTDEEKAVLNNFLAHSMVATILMRVAHAEESLHHIMNDDKKCEPKKMDKAVDSVHKHNKALQQAETLKMIDETIAADIKKLNTAFNDIDILDNVRKQLHCKPIVESMRNKLQLTCIEPCIRFIQTVENQESNFKMLGNINNNSSERVIATVKALNKQSKFIVDYWAWGLYIDILHAKVDDYVFEDDDYITFLQNYTLHYNTLDVIERIIHGNPNSTAIRDEKNTVTIGSKISGITPHPFTYEEITLGDKTFIMNGTRSQLK